MQDDDRTSPLPSEPAPPRARANGRENPAPPSPDPARPTGLVPPVEEILELVRPRLPPEHEEHIRVAYRMGLKAHEGQRRRSGEPYFVHCVEVAKLLAELVHDWPTIAAGLLHDTIEDCGVTVEEIRARLPDPVAELVDGVTKISKIHFSSDSERQAENLRKMILAMARDVRVVLVKLCDRLHNMRTLDFVPPEKQKVVAQATIEIYAPLAKRLGMERICRELEDLTLKYTHPVLYRRLGEHIERNRERYESIIERTRQILEGMLAKRHIPGKVSGRLKHIHSIYRKMLQAGLDLDELHDLMAIRVIVDTIPQTYEVVGLVHSRWKPYPNRFKDYIASPKPNGYQSIHTTVIGVDGQMTEIQIRTREMHRLADEGIAAHWQYKEKGSGEGAETQERERLAWLRQLLDWLTDIRDPAEFMTAVKKDVFDSAVFCYTPRGDVIEMPRGSTVLDFAFRIHTDLGHHCAGAKVNHKMAPIRTVLKTGDVVEIVSNKSAHPTPDWLQIAESSRARNKIRHWLKTHNAAPYIDRGRSMLMESLRQRAPEMGVPEAMEALGRVASQFTMHSAEDVLIEIGFGSLKAGLVAARIAPPGPPPVRKRVPRKLRKAPPPDQVVVDGLPGAITRLAQCCSPKPGDPVVGFVTQGRGISVHRADCRAFQRILLGKDEQLGRIVGVHWGGAEPQAIVATVRLVCQDRKSLLNDVTHTVSLLGLNIVESNTKSNMKTGHAILRYKIQVPDEASLNMLLTRLASIPSVRSVSRVLAE